LTFADIEVFRSKIGVIFQDFNKYELSLRENIGFGNLNHIVGNDEIFKAINKVKANNILSRLSRGLDTILGNWFGGTQLSGGQWQRVSLARAFMKNASIYILDEPTSSLDPISEHEIFEIANNLWKDKMGIFISHKLSSLKKINCRIIILSDGKVVGDGFHNELINNNKEYIELYNI